jgi:heptosyltransferase-2
VVVALKYKYIGDAVLATPLLRALAGSYNRPHVLVAPHLKQLLQEEPGLEFLDAESGKSVSQFFSQLRTLRGGKYDVALLVNRNVRSALLARLAGIKRRIGFPTEGRGFLLTDRVPYDDIGPEGASYARLGEPLGLAVPTFPPTLSVSDAERALGERLLDGATVGIQPGASWSTRALPTEFAAQIANELSAAGHSVALIGGKDERSFTEALLPKLRKPPADLVGNCKLRETMGALAGLKVFIAADSGIVHTAVALGVPTVTTFSLSPALKWGHDYPPHRVFVAPDRDMTKMDVDGVIAAAFERLS